jgi:hypothetical protein
MTTRVHIMRLACMEGITSLSLYGCSAVNDDDLAILARSPLAASLQLLILCGTNITDAGIKVSTPCASFSARALSLSLSPRIRSHLGS